VSRIGSSKAESVIVDRDDAGSSLSDHSHIAARANAHFVQPRDNVRLPVNVDNPGR